MKVLSIDWDYFQKVSVDTMRRCYPDGLDATTFLSEITWGSHYATDGEEINGVTVMQDELENLFKTLLSQDRDIPVMIANSHVHIYDFIHSNLPENDTVLLTNIDMHHDLMNENEMLDCGNWIGKLFEDKLLEKQEDSSPFKWVRNPESFEMYLGDREGNDDLGTILKALGSTETVADIKDDKYDLIFLARSDTWSPPHLDNYFCLLTDLMKEHFEDITVRDGVDNPRKAYLQYAVTMREATEKFRNQMEMA
ncbi:MAG: hypothetical protein IJK26_09350 [Clostridia bacterium]|nr:hypothetical protein [Clostridia bacterium]